eukprot:827547-Prorocentrum_lima.AAC.1
MRKGARTLRTVTLRRPLSPSRSRCVRPAPMRALSHGKLVHAGLGRGAFATSATSAASSTPAGSPADAP